MRVWVSRGKYCSIVGDNRKDMIKVYSNTTDALDYSLAKCAVVANLHCYLTVFWVLLLIDIVMLESVCVRT